jgi:hypothetical protein
MMIVHNYRLLAAAAVFLVGNCLAAAFTIRRIRAKAGASSKRAAIHSPTTHFARK